MRKQVNIETKDAIVDIICDSYEVIQAAGGGLVFVTFEGGLDEDGSAVYQLVFSGTSFVMSATSAPDEEMITITRAHYDALNETVAILSDEATMADLKEAEADIAAGNLTEI